MLQVQELCSQISVALDARGQMKLVPCVNLPVACYIIELSSDFATKGNTEKSLYHLDGAWSSANEIRPPNACKMAHVFNNNELLTTA